MDLGLAGKAVVITGGSKGIGLACATIFAAEGARVVIASRTQSDLDAAAAEVEASTGQTVHPVSTDIRSSSAVTELMDSAVRAVGGVDILVNNAGAALAQPYGEFTDDHWTEALNYKLLGYLRCTMAAIPLMKQRGGGRIVNVAGSAAREPNPWSTSSSAINASLLNITKTLSATYAADGILVNAVNPGPIATDRWKNIAALNPGRTKEQVGQIPLGRMGRPEDIANAVVFLSSAASSFTTGVSLTIDGGRGSAVVF